MMVCENLKLNLFFQQCINTLLGQPYVDKWGKDIYTIDFNLHVAEHYEQNMQLYLSTECFDIFIYLINL